MSHLVYEINGEASMAYVGTTPWHGLGQKLDPNTDLDTWIKKAHLDWAVGAATVNYNVPMGFRDSKIDMSFGNRKVLFRTDTLEPLSVVSDGYKIVQPTEIMEFYRGLIKNNGFQMHTAGSLDDGKRIWALAKIGEGFALPGDDRVDPYLLLATSYDKSLATTLMFTSIRVVCNNTLSFAYDSGSDTIKVPHSKVFDAEAIKIESDLVVHGWDDFKEKAEAMADRDMTFGERAKFFTQLVVGDDADYSEMSASAEKAVMSLMDIDTRGTKFKSDDGTLWGALNAVTEYVDHEKPSRSKNNRLKSAWNGIGSALKKKAWVKALNVLSPKDTDNG